MGNSCWTTVIRSPNSIEIPPSPAMHTTCRPGSALSSPAILFTNYAAPCRQALGPMLVHPLCELRRAHQAGLHRDVGEVRGGDGLLVAICRRGEIAEHGDDLDHDWRAPSLRCAFARMILMALATVRGCRPSAWITSFFLQPRLHSR